MDPIVRLETLHQLIGKLHKMFQKIQQSSEFFPDAIPFIMEGQVVATDDPEQMGRVKVWIPALDGEKYNVDFLPWTNYASPFFGFTKDYPKGAEGAKNSNQSAYGFWAIPKIGAVVLVFCLNANPDQRYYFASKVLYHKNRSLPAGQNFDKNGNVGPFGELLDGARTQPAFNNLSEQFSGQLNSPQAKSRGAFERQVASDNGNDGYSTSPVDESYVDPQTYCFVTPSGHAMIFQDDPKFARLRVKTSEGHQIILDDTNERIYISTAKGKTWIELDQDGHLHVFAAESMSFNSRENINFHASKDINLYAENNINLKANTGTFKIESGGDMHLKSIGSIFSSACESFSMLSEKDFRITSDGNLEVFSQSSVALTASSSIDVKGGGGMTVSAKPLHFNGPSARTAERAECAERAGNPQIIPNHEPWSRPASKNSRGPNWRE